MALGTQGGLKSKWCKTLNVLRIQFLGGGFTLWNNAKFGKMIKLWVHTHSESTQFFALPSMSKFNSLFLVLVLRVPKRNVTFFCYKKLSQAIIKKNSAIFLAQGYTLETSWSWTPQNKLLVRSSTVPEIFCKILSFHTTDRPLIIIQMGEKHAFLIPFTSFCLLCSLHFWRMKYFDKIIKVN